MKEDLIADLWNVVIEHIPEKSRKDVASDFVNTLLDHGVKDSVVEGMLGIDPYLDDAIEYAIDGEVIDDDYDDDYNEEDE
jgi:hypothetical protein